MDSIWKINSKFISDNDLPFDNIYFCSHCIAHTESLAFRKMLIKVNDPPYIVPNKYDKCSDFYSQPKFYTKCYICDRYIQGIQNGPDIIKYLDDAFNYEKKCNKIPECESSIYLQLGKVSTWYYHKPYDYFGHFLKNRYGLNSAQTKNIYQSMNELYGLPSFEIINEKSDHIINMVNNKIVGNIIN
jgi:hypothetical protein